MAAHIGRAVFLPWKRPVFLLQATAKLLLK